MPILTEAQLEQDSRVRAKERDCILLKIQGTKGWPDRLLLGPNGSSMFIEFKRVGMWLRPLQAEILAQLRAKGFKAVVVRTREEFELCLSWILSPLQRGNLDLTKLEE